MDGVFEVVEPGGTFTYEFEAWPAGMHLYHCHTPPLKKHIHKGLYGAFIIDPAVPRAPAQELVMVMNGFDTDGDGENNFYTVNGRTFYYARYPIKVRRGETVRIYLANLTEFDLINSFHLHGEMFRWYPTGTGTQFELTDTVMLCQGQRGIIEIDFTNTGLFMFHAHQSEFTDLGWMGFFDVVDDEHVRGHRRDRPRPAPAAGCAGCRSSSCRSWSSARWWPCVSAGGDRLTGLVGDNPPAADEFSVQRVRFEPGEIRVQVRNPQPQDLTVAVVTVDDAIVPFALDGPQTLGRLRSTTIVVPYAWVEGDPYVVGITSSTGIQTVHEIPAAVPARDAIVRRRRRLRADRPAGRRRPRRARPGVAAEPAPRQRPLDGGVHGADRRPADVPGGRGDVRGPRAAGRPARRARRHRAGADRHRRQRARARLRLTLADQRPRRRRRGRGDGADWRSRWRRWWPSASASTTSARGWRSARRSRSASSRSAASW